MNVQAKWAMVAIIQARSRWGREESRRVWLPTAQKVRFDRWRIPGQGKGGSWQNRELEATQNLPVQCRVRRGLCRKGADNENLSQAGWLLMELGTRQ